MNNNDSDIFESTQHSRNNIPAAGKNFFLSEPFLDGNTDYEKKRHLNDYDYNLLKEDAYKDVSDDLFRLEYKISNSEKEIQEINKQILTAREIEDIEALQKLSQRLDFVKSDYENLLAMYNNRSLSAKISDTVSCSIKNNIGMLNKKFAGISNKIISKLPKKLANFIEIKKSLATLENINKSVDELMSLKIPYGENIDKYQQLSKYIIRANEIHSQISSYIK